MQNLLLVELLFATIVFFVGLSESFRCFQCRSDSDEGCSSTINASWSKDCPAGNGTQIYCRKIHQKLKFKNEKSWTSIRECAYEKQSPKSESYCYNYKWLELAYQEICECDKENCNSGRRQLPEMSTVALIAFTWIFSYLKTNIT